MKKRLSKDFKLDFISIAWVAETIAVIIFTMIAIYLLDADKVSLWREHLPLISGLILAQGTAAGVGPLAADSIKTKERKGE